jgi:hypothetical protein
MAAPPIQPKSIWFGCVCDEGPIWYHCCLDLRWYNGRYLCMGGWDYYFLAMPRGCEYWDYLP